MAADKIKAQEARELYVLKQKAMQFYEANGVPQRMEEILNSTFYDAPNDVYGHIANFFEKHSVTPTITKICSREVFDSNCKPTMQAEVYCMIKNFEKLVCTLTTSSLPSKIDPYSLKADEKQHFEETRQQTMSDLSNMLKNSINDLVCGLDPCAQLEIDGKMTKLITNMRDEILSQGKSEQASDRIEPRSSSATMSPAKGKKSPKGKGGKGGKEVLVIPDDPPEEPVCGCEALSLASKAICQSAASVKDVPLYEHIARLKHGELPNTLKLPLPVATILCCGKQLPGKLNYVSEFMIVPKPNMPFSKAYKYICQIYHHCAQSLSSKTGAISRNVNDIGALCPPYDRTEQGLDLLQEAITAVGLTPAEDFSIMLQLTGPDCFDYEKGKYEITTGGLKAAEDLADYWGDIVGKYPSLIALIDPLRRVEKAAWMKICERVTETCHVLCDVTAQRAGLFNVTDILPEWRFSGMVLNALGQNTISELIQAAGKLEENGCEVMVGTNTGVSSTFSVDLAIGLQARFLKLGAPMRGERVALYNHLLQLEDQLTHSAMIDTWAEHRFTLIKPPTPPPETDEEEGGDTASPTKDKKV